MAQVIFRILVSVLMLSALRRSATLAGQWASLALARRFLRSISSGAAKLSGVGAASENLKERRDTPEGRKLSRFMRISIALAMLALLVVAGDLVLRGFHREIPAPVWEQIDRKTDPGRAAIIRHGCGGCHTIPGIRHATGRVGPQLAGFRDQMYIAGMLPNIPENVILWITDPQSVNPKTAMPNLQVSRAEAREIAAYLYAQR